MHMLKLVPAAGGGGGARAGVTLRITDQGAEALEPLWAERRPLIYAVWHGRILMVPVAQRATAAHPRRAAGAGAGQPLA